MSNSPLFLTSLGSGSGGNAFFLESEDDALLIDQGFSRKELLRRMEICNCDPAKLRGALLTHEHSDHSIGARVFCDTFNLPLYATVETIARLSKGKKLPKMVRAFEPGAKFEAAGFAVTTFSIPHDVDTVGFRVERNNSKIGFATDLGCVNESIKRHLFNCHALVIESNYDKQMLMNSDRSLDVKRRIMGFRGHLENFDTFGLLGELLGNDSALLLLAHVSRECNDYEMLAGLCAGRLRELNRTDCRFDVLRQDQPSEKFVISSGMEHNHTLL